MGVQTTITIACDYPGCRRGQDGPLVSSWVNEEIRAGKPLPKDAEEFITIDLNGLKISACNRLHMALFFLPDGYETPVLKKVIDFPDNGNFPTEKRCNCYDEHRAPESCHFHKDYAPAPETETQPIPETA